MRRSTAAALAGLVFLGLLLRLLPAARSLYWGADFGEYHRITQGLLAEGQISLDYRGWGSAYPYFPGMHVIQAMGVFAGASPLAAEVLLVPALASTSILFSFLLSVPLTAALLVPHHFPTYFLIVAAFFAVLVRIGVRTQQPEASWKREAAYLAFLLAAALSYWILYATPFPRQIL